MNSEYSSCGVSLGQRLPHQGKVVDPHRPAAVGPDDGAVGDAVVGDPAVELLQRHLQLAAGQVRTEAAVRPGAEGQMAVGRAVEPDGGPGAELARAPGAPPGSPAPPATPPPPAP